MYICHSNEEQMYTVEKGTAADIDELERLYDELNDHLEATINYPGWIKGIYPVRDNAVKGIEDDNLFVLKVKGRIAGSIILSHEPEEAYTQVKWGIETDYANILVIHTLVVHPLFMKQGVGSVLLRFAEQYGMQQNMKAIRLDVSIHNAPAIAAYEKRGYHYIGTVNLGLNYPHLVWFRLYEFILRSTRN